MNFRRSSLFLATAALLGFSACSNTSVVTLSYVPRAGRVVQGTPEFAVGAFRDLRRVPPQQLGTVRLPVGPKVDTIQTRVPVSNIVSNAFAYALEVRGMNAADKQAKYRVTGDVIDLRSQLLVHPYGYARLRVNIVDAASGQTVFTRIYEGERQSTAYRPGSGSPVPILQELTSRALQDAVDKALDDQLMRQRLGSGASRPRYAPGML
ncbi:MAG: hypothetical protein R3F13_17190 [Prosthecobacter sp.]